MIDNFSNRINNPGNHNELDEKKMRECIKEELQKYSYLTTSKNPTTADQIIKIIEMKEVFGQGPL